MTGITVGCDLMIATVASGEMPPVATGIVAVTPPDMSRLYEGQAVQDVTGFAAMTAPANFIAGEGTIDTVTLSYTGSAVDGTTPLSEGDVAGFSVTVTDSSGGSAIFDAGQVTVEFKAIAEVTAGNELEIDINPLVPDAETVAIVVDSGPYADTYTPTAGDLRGTPYNFGGLGAPSVSGDPASGDLTGDEGLWSTSTGALSFTMNWQADTAGDGNFTDIGNTTDRLTDAERAAEAGNAVRLSVTANDGVDSTTLNTAAVSVPAGGNPLTGAILLDNFSESPAASDYTIAAADLTGADEGDLLLFCVASRDGTNNYGHSSVAFDGTACTLLVDSAAAAPATSRRPLASIWSLTAPADRIGDIVVTFSEAVAQPGKLTVIRVPGANVTPVATSKAESNGTTSQSIDINTVTDGLVVICSSYDSADGNPVGYVGLTPGTIDRDAGVSSAQMRAEVALAQVSATANPLSLGLTMTAGDQLAAAAVSLQPA